MNIFKFNLLPSEFYIACESIKKARKLSSEAESLDKSGKAYIVKFIKDHRNIDINNLKIGDKIIIGGPVEENSKHFKNDLVTIEINSQNKFNQQEFQITNGVLFEQFKKPTPVIHYKF